MKIEAITFRAEADFIEAIKTHAEKLGVSVNKALREIVAPAIGFSTKKRTAAAPRNGLAKFCGCLKGVDSSELIATQKEFDKIDEDMWK